MSEVRYDYTEKRLLTEGFTDPNTFLSKILAHNRKFPWDRVNLREVRSDNELAGGCDDLFYCGTATEIQRYLSYDKFFQGERCECCGDRIDNIPFDWMNEQGLLCKPCFTDLRNKHKRPILSFERREEEPWWFI